MKLGIQLSHLLYTYYQSEYDQNFHKVTNMLFGFYFIPHIAHPVALLLKINFLGFSKQQY